jgi:hypothetical protein
MLAGAVFAVEAPLHKARMGALRAARKTLLRDFNQRARAKASRCASSAPPLRYTFALVLNE